MHKLIFILIISFSIFVFAGCDRGGMYSNNDIFADYGKDSVAGDISWAKPSKGGFPLFSISVGTVNDQQTAMDLVTQVKQALGTDDIWIQRVILGYSVNYGYFDSEAKARKEREKIKDKTRQLQLIFVTIVDAIEDPAVPDDFYLLNQRFPLSIEVCRFTNDPKQNYYNRKIDAVQAVKKIRAQQLDAYLIHGLLDSRVYVGKFYDEDLIWTQNRFGKPVVAGQGPRIKSILSRFPYYFFNGLKMKQVTTDRTVTQKLSEMYFHPIVISLDAIESNGLPK
ncbi:MAG: hypothetical protein JEZ07_02620 [Phycisphaerae bacterium]|nr:hypothetical protein [Phycisphaerae bacterium]